MEFGGAGRPSGGRRAGGERVGLDGAALAGEDAIKPWRHRSWIFPRDPQFAVKAARVLDLYERIWDGVALGDDEYVISADEKSQLQALSRCHPELAAGPGRVRRVEFEYERHGTLAYFGAYDVHRAPADGPGGAARPGSSRSPTLVAQVMTTGAVRVGEAGVLDRRQRLLAQRAGARSTGYGRRGPPRRWCTCRCTPAG